MWFRDFDTREAAKFGHSLADQFLTGISQQGAGRKKNRAGQQERAVRALIERIGREAPPLKLGLMRRAKLANTFKWRLLDQGVEPGVADDLTRMLVLRLSEKRSGA